MLAIRMQRTGRSGHAQFRVIVQDSRFSPTRGRVVSYLGSYDPHTKTATLDSQKASQYLQNGAQPSNSVALLFKKEGIKLPSWVKLDEPRKRDVRNPEKRRSTAPAQPAAEASAEAAEETAAEPADEASSEPAEEAPAEPSSETPSEAPQEPEAPSEGTPAEAPEPAESEEAPAEEPAAGESTATQEKTDEPAA